MRRKWRKCNDKCSHRKRKQEDEEGAGFAQEEAEEEGRRCVLRGVGGVGGGGVAHALAEILLRTGGGGGRALEREGTQAVLDPVGGGRFRLPGRRVEERLQTPPGEGFANQREFFKPKFLRLIVLFFFCCFRFLLFPFFGARRNNWPIKHLKSCIFPPPHFRPSGRRTSRR